MALFSLGNFSVSIAADTKTEGMKISHACYLSANDIWKFEGCAYHCLLSFLVWQAMGDLVMFASFVGNPATLWWIWSSPVTAGDFQPREVSLDRLNMSKV